MQEQFKEYVKERLTVNLVWANIFAFILIIPTLLLYGIPYFLIWGKGITLESFKIFMGGLSVAILGKRVFITLIVIIIGIVLHELIHGVVWAIYAKQGFKSIKFGVLWKMLAPYCHCKEPLKVKHYILGALMPAIVLGLLPAILAIIMGNKYLLIIGVFFTIAAGGDFLIINLLRKEDGDSYVEDHPSEAGCYIYRKIEKI